MPFARFSSAQMAQSLRIAGATQWGKGATSNEPGTHPMNASRRLNQRTLDIWPGTDAPQIAPGSTVFAVGSCFAREIERVLGLKGFDIASFIDGRNDVTDKDVNFTNRYNSAAMLLELRRLLEGPQVLPDDALFIPQQPGLFLDAHFHGQVAAPIADLLTRRRRFYEHFQSLRRADVLFFTLGLNEAPFDVPSGLYRNVSPTVRELRQGAQVEVHTFTVAENVAYLEQIVALVRRHCVRNPLIFVTVSPVPLTLTYQQKDVIVANAEGKAILRAAAAEFCAGRSDVTYFHSYEMATGAKPDVVYKGDKRHLRKAFIAEIVQAFLDRHCAEIAHAEVGPAAATG